MSDGGLSIRCPVPHPGGATIQMAHGGGGRKMNDLIARVFLSTFQGDTVSTPHDGAVLALDQARYAFTTDSFVVQPLFFPGGDIGSLAVNGTVNDLSMCGARPLYLSAGFILEEGVAIDTVERIAVSMRQAADRAGVTLVTGDTKVVDHGKGDGVYINTAGIGRIAPGVDVRPGAIQVGDAVLVSGDLARHGMAIMAQREGLQFDSVITSDCAPLCNLVSGLFEAGIDVHCLRDLTRGGLTSALVEIAEGTRLQIHLNARDIPVNDAVRGACEVLGFDPMYVANEGRMVVFVPESQVSRALDVLRAFDEGQHAACVGRVLAGRPGRVTIESAIGTTRDVHMLSGEQLPRIC